MKDKFVSLSPLTTPVLFLIFNRPDITQKVFDAIKKAKPKQLFIATDGPREGKEGEKEKGEQVRKGIEQIDWDCKVKTLFRDKIMRIMKVLNCLKYYNLSIQKCEHHV